MDFVARETKRSLAVIGFGMLKVLAGVFLIGGQIVFHEAGTLWGFVWPRNVHDASTDLGTLCLFLAAGWLIRTGIWGRASEHQAATERRIGSSI